MIRRTKRRTLGLLAAAVLATAIPAHAQTDFPARGIRLVIGFAPGGPTDQVTRVVAERLAVHLKQPVTVENRPGGNGALGAQAVLNSAPDGYTLLVGTSGALTVSPSLLKSMSYKPADLEPVGILSGYPYALVVPSDSPVNDLAGLLDYLKKNPKRTFSSGGPGSVNHLAGEWFANLAGVELVHVPYKGDAAALVDLMAGRLDLSFYSMSMAMPQVKAGKLKAIAVTSAGATDLAPGLEALAKTGFPAFVVEPWIGVYAPNGTPRAVTTRLNDALKIVLSEPGVRTRIAEMGQYTLIDTPDGVRDRMTRETRAWAEVIRSAGIQPE